MKITSCLMVVILQATLFAAEQPAAMLYTHGTAMLNGSTVARSSAIFSGDLVETNASSAANINAAGSIVLVLNDSLVRYQGQAVSLEHGGVTISTSKLMATRAGNIVVSPAVADVWTEFEVRDVDGQVEIAARKGDLTVSDEHGSTTLAQGQETTREEAQPEQDKKKKKKRAAGGAVPAAGGGALNSPMAIGIGGAAVLGLTTWVLVRSDDPASPAKP